MSKPGHHWDQDKEATVYIGNLDERVSDAIVWELMLQAGRIVNVYLPKDRVTQTHQGFGFVEFKSEEDAEYAARIMNQVRLYGKPIRVNKASADKQRTAEIGAELHVRNLDTMVDEKTLYDTFSAFGTLISVPKIARTEDGTSRGFGFISYDSFEAADKAIESMNNQYLMNKQIHVEYAFKKDGKNERHGDAAERLLAAQARKHNVQIAPAQIPAALFAPPAAAVTTPTMPVAGMPQMGGMGQVNPMAMGRGVPTMPMGMQQQYPPQYQMQQQMPYQPQMQQMQQMPPQQQYMQRPPSLPQAPPSGLPARPPPAQAPPRPPPQATPPPPQGFAGYSQPPAMPPGFGSATVPTGPGGLPPRPPQPMGFPAAPPPGFGPPGQQPQGRGGHPPPPPMMPAGFNGYQQRR